MAKTQDQFERDEENFDITLDEATNIPDAHRRAMIEHYGPGVVTASDGMIHHKNKYGETNSHNYDPKSPKPIGRHVGTLSVEEEVNIEESAAADSIKAKGKAASMNAVMDLMKGMGKEDLNHFVATMSQFAAGKDYGVGDNSEKNKATIAMKGSVVKEDIEEMFEGQDLSEEFKEKVSTIFEAALNVRISTETARLEEEYETKLQEELSVFQEEVAGKLDSYLDYVVENWMKENEVAIESTLRNELMDEFVEGLKNLFAEHYIAVPEERVDVLEALAEKVGSLEEKLDEMISENVELKGVLAEEVAKNIFEELSSDLALTQQEKFASLAEGIEFDGNLETYEKKLKIIKENYFHVDSSYSSNIEEETFEGEVAEVRTTDPVISRYAQAISRTIKK